MFWSKWNVHKNRFISKKCFIKKLALSEKKVRKRSSYMRRTFLWFRTVSFYKWHSSGSSNIQIISLRKTFIYCIITITQDLQSIDGPGPVFSIQLIIDYAADTSHSSVEESSRYLFRISEYIWLRVIMLSTTDPAQIQSRSLVSKETFKLKNDWPSIGLSFPAQELALAPKAQTKRVWQIFSAKFWLSPCLLFLFPI